MTPPAVPASAPAAGAVMPAERDSEHLRLLAIFHFVHGIFAFGGIAFLALHYLMMRRIFAQMKLPELEHSAGGPPIPFAQGFLDGFIAFYVVMGLFLMAMALANVLCGRFLLKRKFKMFCLIAAGFQCLSIPFGTVLGIFTIYVLGRDSVQAKFKINERAGA